MFPVASRRHASRRHQALSQELRNCCANTSYTSPTAYLALVFGVGLAFGFGAGASTTWGFEKCDGSSLGFTTTFSKIVFSDGTEGVVYFCPGWETERTFVSRTNGI